MVVLSSVVIVFLYMQYVLYYFMLLLPLVHPSSPVVDDKGLGPWVIFPAHLVSFCALTWHEGHPVRPITACVTCRQRFLPAQVEDETRREPSDAHSRGKWLTNEGLEVVVMVVFAGTHHTCHGPRVLVVPVQLMADRRHARAWLSSTQ